MVRNSIAMALLVIVVLSLLNIYTFFGFLYDVSLLKKYWIVTASLMALMTFFELAYFAIFRNIHVKRSVVIFLSSLVGVSFILFSMAITYDITKFIITLFTQNMDILLSLDFIFVIVTIIYIVFGFVYGAMPPNINIQNIRVKNLKKPLNIIHLSDLHVGKIIRRDFVQNVVNKTNALNPDIVAITGDLVDLEVDEVKHYLEPLRELKTKFGVYYVLGNHEYFHGAKEIVTYLKTLDIIVLENENVEINKTVNLIGLNDLFGNTVGILKPDIQKAFSDINPNLPNILLAHQPKQLRFIPDEFRVDLMLSGHTHGGQIFPFNLLVMLDQPYVKGFHVYKNKIPIFISNGTGCWGPPIRFLASSEIVKVNLVQ
ncbi:MAG: metallophosphoesterase [Campylobacteraceae bacterium]